MAYELFVFFSVESVNEGLEEILLEDNQIQVLAFLWMLISDNRMLRTGRDIKDDLVCSSLFMDERAEVWKD